MTFLFLAACSTTSRTSAPALVTAEPIGEAECSVCGMIVGEQPSPRGQIVYRDGSHSFVCSIEELRAVAQQRSAKGTPVGLFVEALPASFDVTSTDTKPLPWVGVDEAWFVFGADRPRIMGTPVLSFDSQAHARDHAEALGSTPLGWSPLSTRPFHTVPAEAGIRARK